MYKEVQSIIQFCTSLLRLLMKAAEYMLSKRFVTAWFSLRIKNVSLTSLTNSSKV